MRTTALWSLAFLAGSTVAAPGKAPAYHGGNWTDTTCTEEKSTNAPTAPVYPVTYKSKASPSKSTSWSYGFSGNSSSYGPTATGSYGSGSSSTVTVITTTYTTVCPETSTWTIGGYTSLSTYPVTSTVTETLTSTVPVAPGYAPSWSQGSPNGPGSYPSQSEVSAPAYETTVTAVTAVYTTVCPATTTGVNNGKTITRTYETVSTLTSTWYETITLSTASTATGHAHGSAPAESVPYVIVTDAHTTVVHVTAPVSPVPTGYGSGESSSVAGGYGGESTSIEGGHGGQSSSVGGGNGGSHSSGAVFLTTITQTQTIIVEKTTTAVQEGTTVTKTYSGTSLQTSVYTSTCTEGASTLWTSVHYGSTVFSYTLPWVTSTSEASSSATSSAETSSSEKPWYPITSGSSSSYPGGYGSGSPSGYKPSSSKSGSSGTGSVPVVSSKTSTKGSPSGGGSVPVSSKTSTKASPSGSGSVPVLSKTSTKASPSGSVPVSSKTSTNKASPSGSVPVSSVSTKSSTKSFGSGTVSKPTQSASIVYSIPTSSKTSSSSTSSCIKPTATPSAKCIPCENQPSNDVDNNCGYTIEDNWYMVTPKTCRTVEYNFEITNGTVAPDGVSRVGFLINGQFPGPLIEANWGDTVVVHVTNSLANNGSSIHFHGLRQFWTNEMDGVPSITQCALAPGSSMTYTWTASNYGSSWYHSHFAIQTYGGVFGPITIHGPATAEYDYEESVLIQDWEHQTVDSMYDAAQTQGPRTLDTGLINGLNVWGGADGAAGTTGKRWSMTVVSGKRYRLRLVNVAIQSTFKFYLDSHKFKVIAMDFVPIVPYETEIVNINIGQRYDLVFTADQSPGNYWLRADVQNACAVVTKNTNIKAIVSYEGVAPSTPTSTAYTYTSECIDEPLASLVPYLALNAEASPDQQVKETVAIGKPNGNYFKWTLSGTTFQSQWGDPTLNSIFANDSIPTYSGSLAIEVPNLKEWVYIIIDSPIPTPHPIHLHGHDFFILAQGTGLYTSSVVLNTVNPPRRDVALMPYSTDLLNGGITGGHLVLAFETDNPGAWLMHCHIGWHVSMGFALQIIEGQSLIKDTVTDSCQMEETCAAWNSYTKNSLYDVTVTDSGV